LLLAFDPRPSAKVGSQQRESSTDWNHRNNGACPIWFRQILAPYLSIPSP
jgi:hypothetical protein